MTKEEAIEVYNGLINTKIKEAFEFFAPELIVNKDENVKEDLIGGIMWQRDNLKSEGPHDNNLMLPGFCFTVGEQLAYLEKQKDASKAIKAVDMIDKYIDEHVANAHDMKDSNPDKKYYCGWDDALGKMAGILQDVYSDEKQKEQKPVEYLDKDKIYAIMTKLTNLSYSQLIPINSDEYWKLHEITSDVRSLLDYPIEQKPAEWDKLQADFRNINEAFEDGKKEVIANPEKYGLCDCKPAEWSEEDKKNLELVTDCVYEFYPDPVMKYKLKDWLKSLHSQIINSTPLYTIEQVDEKIQEAQEWSEEDEDYLTDVKCAIYDYFDEGNAEDLYNWLKSLPERFNVKEEKQKWSEEDERILKGIIGLVDHNQHYNVSNKEMLNWLKSLRPPKNWKEGWCEDCKVRYNCWKPSEEQMEALNALNCQGDLSYVGQQKQLISLYNDLKKLI